MDNAANRELIFQTLKRELVGPSPAGDPISIGSQVILPAGKDQWHPFYQAENGEEIITRDTPTTRYGVGVLYPPKSAHLEEELALGSEVNTDGIESKHVTDRAKTEKRNNESDEIEEFDISLSNSLKPSSMGISFLVDLASESTLTISASGGRYEPVPLKISGATSEITWWKRVPVTIKCTIDGQSLLGANNVILRVTRSSTASGFEAEFENDEPLYLSIELVSRPSGEDRRLITVSLVNRTQTKQLKESEGNLFQSHFSVSVTSPEETAAILPYPTPESRSDREQAEIDLLYRDMPVFATGHGCAADWELNPERPRVAASVSAECLPKLTLPATTPVVLDDNNSPIEISMSDLSTLEVDNVAWQALQALIERYRSWIHDQRAKLSALAITARQMEVGDENLDRCEAAADRMERGLEYLRNDPVALQAFRLANKAVLLQQVTSSLDRRTTSFDESARILTVSGESFDPSNLVAPKGKGNWRPFQICFLLATIESKGDPESLYRDDVELIWFPTGGGKTETYLGLTAFSIFLRRLLNPNDSGVEVLMRYTLRLLTTQQFERASSLICAMEWMRSQDEVRLGQQPISIGLWVGGSTTKNRKEQATKEYDEYQKFPNKGNPYVINKCPWCGAGFDRTSSKIDAIKKYTPGYRKNAKTKSIEFYCPDIECHFHKVGLPIVTVDDEVYEKRPTLVIGTIDKFAQLTWVPEARALFGINEDGERDVSPPGLIIQDELHLITGPLGSIAGLFETVIERLCTDEEAGLKPKIVCATATTRSYQDQTKALYNRDIVNLFPPAGIEESDSFFSRLDPDADGRMYVGVHAPGFGSFQTEWVRTLASLIQAPMELPKEERDPWWTLLMFCNSIRDMGTAHTLMDSDIRDYLNVINFRNGFDKDQRRYLNDQVQELTSSLQRGEIKKAMDDLSITLDSEQKTTDVCLATSIIEVGIDIPRLALMAVAGQPKTTAQYIQVTGRVGRRADRPGLVVTMYGPSKPRDRSHFEMFRGYHERLYAQVEPSSVTPFSPPALDRALHSVIVAYIRQAGIQSDVATPQSVPSELVDMIYSLLDERVADIDPAELETLREVFSRRMSEWEVHDPSVWQESKDSEGQNYLMYYAGEHADNITDSAPWSTLGSMRNVDSECLGRISKHYHLSQQG